VSDATLFDRVGGTEFFQRLAAAFYASVRTDPVLLALYPQPDDLDGAAQRLALFLMQYWGGPTTYSDERGHPRLRMRHAAYPIDESMRDRWLSHMNAALDSCAMLAGQSGADRLSADVAQEMRDYFLRAADHLRNV
jgi:hemoglobin